MPPAQGTGQLDARLAKMVPASEMLSWCLLLPTSHTMPSKPCRPHFLPATWQPNLRASCTLFPGEGRSGWVSLAFRERQTQPCPDPVLRDSPFERLKITEALKVSPAPRVSTTRGGGKASECRSWPSGPRASAPASAQAQMSVAL